MRPAGEVRMALIQAAHDIVREIGQPGRGATLAEMCARARIETEKGVMQVSMHEARNLVPKIKSSGALDIVGTRRVNYRNRPVAEYAPPSCADHDEPLILAGCVVLGNCLATWAR
jgi:hypothetical protein